MIPSEMVAEESAARTRPAGTPEISPTKVSRAAVLLGLGAAALVLTACAGPRHPMSAPPSDAGRSLSLPSRSSNADPAPGATTPRAAAATPGRTTPRVANADRSNPSGTRRPVLPAAETTGTPSAGASSPRASGYASPSGSSYQFKAAATAAGRTPPTEVTLSGLTTSQGSTPLTFTIAPLGPSDIYLDAFSASSVAYPINGLRACVAPAGQSCSPAAIPNPSYWPITGQDLAHHGSYLLTVTAPPTASLLGLRLGWAGAHAISAGGLTVAGGCSVSTGYRSGCGFDAHAVSGASGTATITSATSGLHLSVKDKTTGTKLFSSSLNGSAAFSTVGGDEWAAHFYPESGAPIPDVSVSLRWP